MKWLLYILFAAVAFGQSDEEIKAIVGASWHRLIEVGAIEQSNARILSPAELDMLTARVRQDIIDAQKYHTEDLLIGIAWTVGAGLAMGVMESDNFGYKYPGLPENSDLRWWLMWDKPGDFVFDEALTPHKVMREVDRAFGHWGWERIYRYTGRNFWLSYLIYFPVYHTTASMYRDWAKYGDIFRSWNVNFIFVF